MAAVAAEASTLPSGSESWSNVTITNPPGLIPTQSLVSHTFCSIKTWSTNPSIDEQKAKAIAEFVEWAVTRRTTVRRAIGIRSITSICR
ncbi:MAG: hypothetical protein P0116_13785 [Candidatus Nitrosocosmicus sp.]|nr:hypothetical protein [Candidatus Nitrosocosmicus sp.]